MTTSLELPEIGGCETYKCATDGSLREKLFLQQWNTKHLVVHIAEHLNFTLSDPNTVQDEHCAAGCVAHGASAKAEVYSQDGTTTAFELCGNVKFKLLYSSRVEQKTAFELDSILAPFHVSVSILLVAAIAFLSVLLWRSPAKPDSSSLTTTALGLASNLLFQHIDIFGLNPAFVGLQITLSAACFFIVAMHLAILESLSVVPELSEGGLDFTQLKVHNYKFYTHHTVLRIGTRLVKDMNDSSDTINIKQLQKHGMLLRELTPELSEGDLDFAELKITSSTRIIPFYELRRSYSTTWMMGSLTINSWRNMACYFKYWRQCCPKPSKKNWNFWVSKIWICEIRARGFCGEKIRFSQKTGYRWMMGW